MHVMCRNAESFSADVSQAVELSMCEGDGKSWAYRTCSECGAGKLDDYLAPVKDYQGVLSWQCWTTNKVTLAGTKKTAMGGKKVTRKMLERREGTIKQLLEELSTGGSSVLLRASVPSKLAA